jgi:hypothetical protein
MIQVSRAIFSLSVTFGVSRPLLGGKLEKVNEI